MWTDEGRGSFTELLRQHTVLKKISLSFANKDNDANDVFKSEIKFYTKMKSQAKNKEDKYKKVMRSCDPTQMFENLQELIEDNDEKAGKMPVRKFYNNTFNTSLNKAIFTLKKKQDQNQDDMEYFTTEGMIKFVAF